MFYVFMFYRKLYPSPFQTFPSHLLEGNSCWFKELVRVWIGKLPINMQSSQDIGMSQSVVFSCFHIVNLKLYFIPWPLTMHNICNQIINTEIIWIIIIGQVLEMGWYMGWLVGTNSFDFRGTNVSKNSKHWIVFVNSGNLLFIPLYKWI